MPLSSFKFALSLAIGMLLAAPVASAQDCGAADQPCETASGTYHVLTPDVADPKGIVIHLHGGGGTGKGMLKSGMAQTALARGYVFVAPTGFHPDARWTKDWSVKSAGMSVARDDKVFLQEVLADVRGTFDLVDAPVLLAGFSRGGSMVWDMACANPDFADAYAPLAGAFWDPLPETCAGQITLFHTHGWNDRTVPLEGRSFANGTIVQGDVWQGLKVLRANNGCANRQPEENEYDGDLWLRHWTDCAEGELHLMLHKGGHGAPKGWSGRMLDWFEGLG